MIARRNMLKLLAATGLPLPGFVLAQDSVLPLNTPGLDHIDVMVEDVEATTRFYMGVFNTTLYAQPFRGAFRYFVLLGELKEGREVGYLAVGLSRGRGNYIGHFCTTVYDWRENSQRIFSEMERQFAAAGLGQFPGTTGFGGLFVDPDGIEIQFLPAPDTLVTAAEPSDLVPWQQGLVRPLGLHSVHLRVSDLEQARRYYEVLYGPAQAGQDGEYFFDFPASETRLILAHGPYEYGQQPAIASFGIKVEAFDPGSVSEGLEQLGATLLPTTAGGELVRFRDPDGAVVHLHPV